MLDSEKKLLEYNNKGILSSLLAIEEHLSQIDDSDINDSWCLKKHGSIALEHHLSEAINHSSSVSAKKSEQYKAFKKKLKTALKNPNLSEVRALRNQFRAIIEDRTLVSDCEVCKFDTHGLEKGEKDLYSKSLIYSNEQDTANWGNPDVIEKNREVMEMVQAKDLAVMGVGQFVGYGYKELANYADQMTNTLQTDPVYKKPSTWVDIIGGAAMAVAAMKLKGKKKGMNNIRLLLAVVGTQRVADRVVQIAKESTGAAAPAPTAGLAFAAPSMLTPRVLPRVQEIKSF